jgi:hypothetical protein
MLTPAAYSIYSAALHADWHSIIGNWIEVTMSDGTRAEVISPHRVAIWGQCWLPPPRPFSRLPER